MLQVYESSDHGIFRVDDVFVTGMLAEKANVSHRDISDLITFYKDWYKEVSRETKCRCPWNQTFGFYNVNATLILQNIPY